MIDFIIIKDKYDGVYDIINLNQTRMILLNPKKLTVETFFEDIDEGSHICRLTRQNFEKILDIFKEKALIVLEEV